MLNSNLIQLLSKLSANEFRVFGEYIRSSFFNKNEGVTKLYEFIKIYYPDFSKNGFEKEYVYDKLFPKVKYDDAFMRKLMFNLAKLAEDFIVYKNFSNDKFAYSKSLLKELSARNLKKLYKKKLNTAESEFRKQKFRDLEYYKNKYHINSLNRSYEYGEYSWEGAYS